MRKDAKYSIKNGYKFGHRRTRYETKRLRQEDLSLYEFEGDDGETYEDVSERPPKQGGVGPDRYNGGNFGLLSRYLAKQVGRPWNKVWSEIRERIPPGHPILGPGNRYLHHTVCFEVELRGSTPYHLGRKLEAYGGVQAFNRYYVHPRSGLLCNTPLRKKRDDTRGLRSGNMLSSEQGDDYVITSEGAAYIYREHEGVPQWFRMDPVKDSGEKSLNEYLRGKGFSRKAAETVGIWFGLLHPDSGWKLVSVPDPRK